MAKLKRRTVTDVEETLQEGAQKLVVPIRFEKVLSTGSTILDLAISGDKVYGGGIPAGILMEIFGLPMSGKTALLMEIIGSCIHHNGDYRINDPESRIDEEYVAIYGVQMEKEKYIRTKTVTSLFDDFNDWSRDIPKDFINVYGSDSLAALSTDMELSEKGDKRGQRRAKEFSEGFRKTCQTIAGDNILFAATNQVREDEGGYKTPGGWAMPFYASLRINISPSFPNKFVKRKLKIRGQEVEKITGVRSTCKVVKSSVSSPFREAEVFIIFNVGVDDVRGNLHWLKEVQGLKSYNAVTKSAHAMEDAIQHIEQNNLEADLRTLVIDTWLEIEQAFQIERKPKVRW